MKLNREEGGRSGGLNNMGLGNLRNKNCYCGSDKKFKKCHLYIDMPDSVVDLREKIKLFQIRKIVEQQAKKVVAKKDVTRDEKNS